MQPCLFYFTLIGGRGKEQFQRFPLGLPHYYGLYPIAKCPDFMYTKYANLNYVI